MGVLFLGLILLLVFYGIWYYGHRWNNHVSIERWMKHLDLKQHQRSYHQLFSCIDGFELSRQARTSHNAFEYTYGEIEFISFIALIGLTKPNEKTVFYDLGSGVGKAVFACSMVFNVRKSCGIELFDSLHRAALSQTHQLLQNPRYRHKSNQISFIHANFLGYDFYDATLVFINATGFFGETWTAINQQLENLNVGTWVITSSKKLSSNAFIIIRVTSVCMSWGVVKAYIHQRIDSTIYS